MCSSDLVHSSLPVVYNKPNKKKIISRNGNYHYQNAIEVKKCPIHSHDLGAVILTPYSETPIPKITSDHQTSKSKSGKKKKLKFETHNEIES